MENLNLAGIDRVFVCTAISSTTVFFTHCALRLKRSGTAIPRMELVEVGPSMDLVVRRHRLPNDSLKKEAMKTTAQQPKKKVCMNNSTEVHVFLLLGLQIHYVLYIFMQMHIVVRPFFFSFLQMKNVKSDALQGKIGKIYMPDQQVDAYSFSVGNNCSKNILLIVQKFSLMEFLFINACIF